MSKHLIQLDLQRDDTQVKALLDKSTSAPNEMISELVNMLEGLGQKAYNGSINVKLGCDYASLAGTFTGLPSNNETIIIGGVTFTAKSSGATGDQFNVGADATASAANLAAAINASTTNGISSVISASSLLGVITLRCLVPGKVGNLITVTEALTNFTLAGSGTKLASGDQDTNKDYLFGRVKETS